MAKADKVMRRLSQRWPPSANLQANAASGPATSPPDPAPAPSRDIIAEIFRPAPGFEPASADPTKAPVAERKWLLVRIWESLAEADRQVFLSRLDNCGAFVRRAP